jgi:4-nitrophenyl phosphatase
MASDWSAVRGLLIDLDGVVYTGSEPVPGAGELIREVRQRGLPFLLVTNNSTTSPELVAARLKTMGIEAKPGEVLTSGQAAAAYVSAQTPGARVYLVGEAGLRQAIVEAGLEITENSAADWVIAGLDRQFDYQKLTHATRAILAGARFLATNADALLPIEQGNVIPGAGTMVAAIQTATGVVPIVTGKPEPALFEHGLQRLGGLKPEQAVMIGDRLDTDVVGGQRAGLHTILVLTGVTTAAELGTSNVRPDAVVPNLPAVAALLWK